MTEPVAVIHGDCIEVMRDMPEASIDAIVTDPPYGLGFMGKAWDDLPPGEEWARQCMRVLKPGGHLLAFGGTRTWHRLAVAVEDAGFEIRDSVAWLYGSGFPKSRDISKDMDRLAGVPRARVPLVGGIGSGMGDDRFVGGSKHSPTAPLAGTIGDDNANTDAARQWQGWGTALKPAFEPIVVARKPLVGTVATNVQAHGTGALNIGDCRLHAADAPDGRLRHGGGSAHSNSMSGPLNPDVRPPSPPGRWPANVALDDDQAAALDVQSGMGVSRKGKPRTGAKGNGWGMTATGAEYDDNGGASRFFYCAKAPKNERPVIDGIAHPTVKPLTLMRWLVRMVTPPGGTVLDPFAGSGTTIEAAILEGFNVIGIEREADYLPLINMRVARSQRPEPAEDDAWTLEFPA